MTDQYPAARMLTDVLVVMVMMGRKVVSSEEARPQGNCSHILSLMVIKYPIINPSLIIAIKHSLLCGLYSENSMMDNLKFIVSDILIIS